MISAFSVLIASAPNQRLLASSHNPDELKDVLGEKNPDVILVYLVWEGESGNEKGAFDVIARIKDIWPLSLCVTILKYTSQLENAKENGADLALVDGVDAEKLLAAIQGRSV
jgi:DNA-binding NarL/FixJ family response regulator